MATKTKELTAHDLRQFTGTEQYFKHWTGSLVYTDGVQYVGENGGYWIIDLIASYQTAVRLEEIPFQAWKIKPEIVHKDGHSSDGFIATMTDGNENEFVRQEGEFTDLKIPLEFYLIADPQFKAVLLLPSEY